MLAAFAIAVTVLAVGGSSNVGAQSSTGLGSAESSVEGMQILITNDDGVQPGAGSAGLFELRGALCAAGADVAVVAPWSDVSGSSASITFGSSDTRFTLTEPDIVAPYDDDCAGAPSGGAVWGACVTSAASPPPCGASSTPLTPADAATLGATAAVQELLGWADGPDLVVSGVNRGGNDGLNVNISGTVGAATIASSLGFPAIALSASSSGDSVANGAATADWAVDFIGLLAAKNLLPMGYILNVNHPRVDRGPVTEAEWTDVAQRSPFATGYVRTGLDFESVFAFCSGGPTCGDPEPGSDSAVYGSGKIAITPVSVDRTVRSALATPLTADLFRVRLLVRLGLADPS